MNLGPDYAWLKPSEVCVDDGVQRRYDATHANKIAKVYDPSLFGLGHASMRPDGRYYVLDGQHRVSAAKTSGHGDIPVLFRIYRGLTDKAEANLFLLLNDLKKAPNALEKFRLAVKAGHPIETHITRILENFGLRIAGYHSDGGIAAVNALLQIYFGRVGTKPVAERAPVGLPDGQLLSRTLHVISKAWGKERAAYDALLLKGVAATIHKHGAAIDGAQLAQLLAKRDTPVATIGKIKSHANTANKTTTGAAVELFENLYNRRKGAAKRLGK